ncbi:restriction endonuclease subunit S, partial [Candidatus Poribacteria bacterium]|nr:restriction endonuclease subunit S [Candidatus Poribacteria bacterium]
TESEISKLQDLKKGMMQQLLTQGIGHTQFKDSPVGRIPVGWEVKTLQNIIKKIIDNRGKTPPLSDTGYELLEVASITDNSRFPDFSTVRKFVDRNTYETWFRNGHPLIGDILVPTVGSIGQFAITRENRGCIAQNLVALRVNKFTDSTYTYYLLNGDVVESRISSILMGAVQPSLRVPHFMGISIPIPSLVEQQKIADILTSIDDSIQQQQRELQQTQNLKKSLMQDLLTGKVRVKVG